jgi:hypothetical protein
MISMLQQALIVCKIRAQIIRQQGSRLAKGPSHNPFGFIINSMYCNGGILLISEQGLEWHWFIVLVGSRRRTKLIYFLFGYCLF